MKENRNPQEGEKRKARTHQGRWNRGVDGTLRYKGVCPFNRTVCKLINALTPKKVRQSEV
jgi:hypothetical protein